MSCIPHASTIALPDLNEAYINYICRDLPRLQVERYLSYDLPEGVASDILPLFTAKGYFVGRYVFGWSEGVVEPSEGQSVLQAIYRVLTYETKPTYRYYLTLKEEYIPQDKRCGGFGSDERVKVSMLPC